jgi:hypothetical protein
MTSARCEYHLAWYARCDLWRGQTRKAAWTEPYAANMQAPKICKHLILQFRNRANPDSRAPGVLDC